MTEEQIVDFLVENIDYFTTNNLVIWILRQLGWLLAKGLNIVIDVLRNLYDHTFALVDITNWGVLKNFLDEYDPLIEAMMVLSLIIVGYLFLFGKDKKNEVFTSLMIFAVVTTSSSYLFSTFNTMSIMFKDAVAGEDSVADGYELVNQNLYDLLYIDEHGGLIQMNAGTAPPQYAENSFDKTDMNLIDITETLDYSRDGLTSEAEDILSKRLEYASDESRLIDVYNGVAWTSFGNTFYYRYQFNFGTYFLLALASIFVYIGLAYKNVKIIYELFVGRILATLLSGDLTGKRKMVRILEAIRDGYYALCFTAITLRSFFLFSDYITGRNFNGFERGVMVLILAFVVIDGANLIQQITGIDAGSSSMVGKMLAGMHMARGAVSAMRNAKQMSQMKRQTKSLESMQNSSNSQNEKASNLENQSSEQSADRTSEMDRQTSENTAQSRDSDSERSAEFTESSTDQNTENYQNMDESTAAEYDAESVRHTEEMDGSSSGDTDRRFEAMDQELGGLNDRATDFEDNRSAGMPESGQGRNEEKGMFDRWQEKTKDAKMEGMQEKMKEAKLEGMQPKSEKSNLGEETKAREQKMNRFENQPSGKENSMMQKEPKQKYAATSPSEKPKQSSFAKEHPALGNSGVQGGASIPQSPHRGENRSRGTQNRKESPYMDKRNSMVNSSGKPTSNKKEK